VTPEDLRAAYKQVLSSKDGEIILKDLQARFHIHGSTFSADSSETAYREGQRTVVLFLKSMLQEQKKREDMIENE
tara:strand:+ start:24 stop:248 length:225 start_codon:yes stop_codon:yes gene_type:complete